MAIFVPARAHRLRNRFGRGDARCRAWAALGLLAALALPGCKRNGQDTILIVKISIVAPYPSNPIAVVRVVVESGQDRKTHDFADDGDGDGLIGFPSSFSLQMPARVMSPLRLEVNALDASGAIAAVGKNERLEFAPGQNQTVDVRLVCTGRCDGDATPDAGAKDAGADAPAPGRDAMVLCGNGLLDEGELCDPAIAAGFPGACPAASCDDKVACTDDLATGGACRIVCQHQAVTRLQAGDRCCPAGATAASDSDCSATCGNGTREGEETCDIAIAAGNPGACPTMAACDDGNPCTRDELLSGNTCTAICVHQAQTGARPGDGCCPAGVTATEDSDCPAVCGNWHRDPGELCDRAQASTSPNGCPTKCESPGSESCVLHTLAGTGCALRCASTPISYAAPDDRCCPKDASRNYDSDCPSICGNGVVEPGESCDNTIPAATAGACPTTCPRPADLCLTSQLVERAEDCAARCEITVLGTCSSQRDGCCPKGCAGRDPDCSPSCGNGVVDSGETCDTALPVGAIGACPRSCADANSCTSDQLIGEGTCHARCAFVPVTALKNDDGCCPAGSNNLVDKDCPATCGNGLVEGPAETCDRARAPASPGGCPTTCPPLPIGCTRFALRGAPETCSSQCILESIAACASNDGCCPAGCTRGSDSDCPSICGNAVVEPGEACDVGLTAGNVGACPIACDDGDACTTDVTLGRRIDCTRSCRFDPISSCRTGDGCCPAGCNRDSDADCAPASCGNRSVEAGEACDPPGTCPTRCPSDGDDCTLEVVVGDARACQARCRSMPIRSCSGGTSDRCCPTGCVGKTDVDCAAPPMQPPLL